MQRIITKTFAPGERVKTHTGTANVLVIRDCSASIGVAAYQLSNQVSQIEVKRNDSVPISQYEEVELFNPYQTDITVKYQFSDIDIKVRSSADVDLGMVDVHAVREPIRIEGALNALPVVNTNPLKLPEVFETRPELPDVFKVQSVESAPEVHALSVITIDGAKNIPANLKRKGVIVCAPKTNQDVVTVAGFIPVYAGASVTIPATNALSVTGSKGDVLNVGEAF